MGGIRVAERVAAHHAALRILLLLPASASVNALLFEVEPAIGERVVEAGWELVGHGTEQRALAAGTRNGRRCAPPSTCSRSSRVPGHGDGWALVFRRRSTHRMSWPRAGIDYVLDWAVDDLPVWMDTRHGPLLAVPYSLEINDSPPVRRREALLPRVCGPGREDTLQGLRAGDRVREPRILTLGLHPHLIGIPHRFVYLEQVLGELAARIDTVFMTGSSIADWYRAEVPPEGSHP